jgi:hypothetical protein
MPLDAAKVLGLFLLGRIAGIEQVVHGSLDDVERVAQLVSHAAGHLSNGRQPLATLKPSHVLSLIGVVDQGKVEVHQLIERTNRRLQLLGIARPGFLQRAEQAKPQPGQSDVGVTWSRPISTCRQPTR